MYKNFVIILAVVSLAALLLTQAAIHQSPEFLEGRFLTLLAIDVALIAIFAVLVVIMMTRLIMAWRRGVLGTRLSLRLSGVFFVSSLLPVVLLYALSADGIFRNIESWFSTPLGRAFEKGERFG
ncbi:MAG: hypothetical protein R1F54_08325 [Candidatus Zeuxoniibacter abyssi]|nr:MAG: hypothetical protein R1F54_08325 [Candidatus Persebacteraceae bacterium AB1(2)]